ncbi:MAG: PAN domain-containing protein [Oligoflexales bacterium]
MMKTVVFIVVFLSQEVFSKNLNVDVGCDLIGDHLKTLKKDLSKETCQQLCASHRLCDGFVFVSGWNRCFLKKNIQRQVRVRMISGRKNQKGRENFDFSGKDIKQLSASTVKKCRNMCRHEVLCHGFTYIEGYSTCWIKREGDLRQKVFYCGVKR